MAKKIEILENTLLKLLVRRGTDTDRRNISLSEGELGYTTDTERLFIGNGQPGGVVAGNRYLGSDSDPAATFTTALTGDLVFDTNTKSLCAFKGSGVWERVSSLTESTGDIDVLVDAGDILSNACGRNLSIDTNGRIQTDTEVVFNKIDTAGWAYLNIPRKVRFYDGSSSEAFTFPTNALGGKYLRTDASGVLTWEDPVGAAEFFYNSENGPIPVGAVLPFTAGGVIPTGYIVCNGQEVSQTTYSDLFDVIGTNYGTTNPGASFKVPDYSLSTLYGVDSDPHNAQVYKVGADVNIGGVQLHKTFFAIGSVEDSGATSQAATTSVTPSTLVSSTANAAACWDSYNNTISTDWSSVFTGYNAFNQGNTPSRTELRIHNPIVAEGGTDNSDQSFYDYKVQIDWESNTVIGTALNNGGNSSAGNKMRVLNASLLSGDNEYAFLRIPTTATNGGSTSPVIRINKELRKITAFPYSEATTKERDPNIAVEITEYEVGISSGTTITQEGFGSYSSGWVNSGDNGTAVANSADLLFNHNLGSSDLVFSYYVADDASGTNAQQLNDQEVWAGLGYPGALIDNINSTSFELKLGNPGFHTPEVDTLDAGGVTSFAGKYVKVVAIAADAVVSTPSTQSPLSAQGTIYVIKAIPDTVANPTLTVVSPLTATVDGVNKTNTAFSPLVGDIVIGQPDAAEAVPPGLSAFNTAGTSTFTTKTRYTKFYVTGSGATGANKPGGAASTIIGYLDLPIGTDIDMQVGAGVSGSGVSGNYSNISINGTELVKSLGGLANAGANTKRTGTVANDARITSSYIIPGGATGLDIDDVNDEEGAGAASFWGTPGAPGGGGGGTGGSATGGTGNGLVMFEWADTVSGGTIEVTGGGGADKEFVGLTGGTVNLQQSSTTAETGISYNVADFTGSGLEVSDIRGIYVRVYGEYLSDSGVTFFSTMPDGSTEEIAQFDGQTSTGTGIGSNLVYIPINKNQSNVTLSTLINNQGSTRTWAWSIIGAEQITSGSGGLKDPNHAGGTINVTTSFQDLDLSSIVGSNKAQVTMEVYDGDTGCNLFFRRKGSVTDPYVIENNAGWGASSVTTGPSNDGGIVTVVTDSSGVTEYRSDFTSTGVKYKVLTYQVIS